MNFYLYYLNAVTTRIDGRSASVSLPFCTLQCGQLACTTAVVLIDLDSRVRLLSVDDDAKVSYKEANEETTIYVIVLWGWSLLG